MRVDRPRAVFAALRGDSGKTFLTVGVGACLRQRGRQVAPFKKGPDYIDAAWLELATGQRCYNLDLFLMGAEGVLSSFLTRMDPCDGALVEGNRGIFDGMDRQGRYSTAELAKLLQSPVVLIVDCSMATRTVAASVLGCQHFDPEVEIRGVILNRINGKRHESIARSAIEERCGLEVLGAVPKIREGLFPERHMGLVPPREHPGSLQAVADAARIAERYVDVDRLWEIACQARPVPWARPERTAEVKASGEALKPRIGVLRDSAFWFYYPDNLEALEMQGASLVECSALKDEKLPPVDALYIGGGFPETHAEALADNAGFRQALRAAVEGGLPVYAECGGLMYLGRELVVKDRVYPMAGVFDLQCLLDGRPQGHGYTILEADAPNPYFSPGEVLHGHEFHYSRVQHLGEKSVNFAFRVQRGCGIHDGRDGLCYRNVLATYSHIHAAGAKGWAKALWKQAVAFGERKKGHP